MTSHSTVSWLGPLSIGAAAMFLLDPSRGRRRRALLRDKTTSLARRSRLAAGGLTEDLQNRARGVVARVRSSDTDVDVDDAVIVARVRSAIGRVCSHPGSIAVSSINGVVELNGPVLAHEHADVLRAAESAHGVIAVIDHTTQHEDASNVPGLQGEGSLPEERGWSPAGMAAACTAAALVAFALSRRARTRPSSVALQDDWAAE